VFTSLLAWDIADSLRVGWSNDNLILLFSDYMCGENRTLFVGVNHPLESIRLVFSWQKKHGLQTRIDLVPDFVIHTLRNFSCDFDVVDNPENADYILSPSRLCALKGSSLSRYRQRVHQAMRLTNARVSFGRIDIQSKVQVEEIESFYTTWLHAIPDRRQHAHRESVALHRLLTMRSEQCVAFGLRVQGKLAAYIIIESISPTVCIVHFEKSTRDILGMSQLLLHRVSCQLYQQGVRWINYEQDLGLTGLRQSKKQLDPVTMLRKYTLIQR